MAINNLPFSSDNGFTTTSNVVANNASFTGNVTTGVILTDNYRYANGVPVDFGGNSNVATNYSNANVASYLPINTSNVAGNNFSVGGNVTLTVGKTVFGNLSGNVTTPSITYTSNAVVIGAGAGVNSNSITNSIAIGTSAGRNSQGEGTVAIGSAAGNTNQGFTAVAIGFTAGFGNQSAYAVAVGNAAGQTGQGQSAIAVGSGAGFTGQTRGAVALGDNAGFESQGANAIAIGNRAAVKNQGEDAIAIGTLTGTTSSLNIDGQGKGAIVIGGYGSPGGVGGAQGANSIAIGYRTGGGTYQSPDAIVLGAYAGAGQRSRAIAIGTAAAGKTSVVGLIAQQGEDAIALGYQAGFTDQFSNSIAIGTSAGANKQGSTTLTRFGGAIAIGHQAAQISQNAGAIAVGYRAGYNGQGDTSIAIGREAGYNGQSINSIVINATGGILDSAGANTLVVKPIRSLTGSAALVLTYNATSGEITQTISSTQWAADANISLPNYTGRLGRAESIKIGNLAGANAQGTNSISIGTSAGFNTQGANSVAIGPVAANNAQGGNAVAVGTGAGFNQQGESAVAIGKLTGQSFQGNRSVAVGEGAANQRQGANAVAIGYSSGLVNQGNNAVAIGALAGNTNQNNNSIAINATGTPLNTTASGFFVAPVRNDSANLTNSVYYNTVTKELTYGPNTLPPPPTSNSIINGNSSISIPNADGNILFTVGGNSAGLLGFGNVVLGSGAGNIRSVPGIDNRNTVAIGANAANIGLSYSGAIAIGNSAGATYAAGFTPATNETSPLGFGAIAIGSGAASRRDNPASKSLPSSDFMIAIGSGAGQDSEQSAISLGSESGSGAGFRSINIGIGAGARSTPNATPRGTDSINIGAASGAYNYSANLVAIGTFAGTRASTASFTGGNNSIIIGKFAGFSPDPSINNLSDRTIILNATGNILPGPLSGALYISPIRRDANSISFPLFYNNVTKELTYSDISTSFLTSFTGPIGTSGMTTVTIGNAAGSFSQGNNSVAIGNSSGVNSQGNNSVSIGNNSGTLLQGANSIAIGSGAGQNQQGNNSVIIGSNAGGSSAGNNSVIIGSNAASFGGGQYSVSIGSNAGVNLSDSNYRLPNNTIVINAQQSNLAPTTSGVFVAPVRNIGVAVSGNGLTSNSMPLLYNYQTHEVQYSPYQTVTRSVPRGTPVTVGNLSAQIANTGNASLQLLLPNSTPIIGSGIETIGNTLSGRNIGTLLVGNTPVYLNANANLGTGDSQRYTVTYVNNGGQNAWEVSVLMGNGGNTNPTITVTRTM